METSWKDRKIRAHLQRQTSRCLGSRLFPVNSQLPQSPQSSSIRLTHNERFYDGILKYIGLTDCESERQIFWRTRRLTSRDIVQARHLWVPFPNPSTCSLCRNLSSVLIMDPPDAPTVFKVSVALSTDTVILASDLKCAHHGKRRQRRMLSPGELNEAICELCSGYRTSWGWLLPDVRQSPLSISR